MKLLRWSVALLATFWLAADVGINAKPQATPGSAAAQTAAAGSADVDHKQLLTRYCVTCHNDKLKTADLSFQALDLSELSQNAPTWEKVVRKLNASAMPPVGRPRPTPAVYASWTSWIEHELDRAAAVKPNAGRPAAFHRLNRVEYQNAIRDILGLDIDVAALLPADDAAFGFDNIGEMLTVSPDRLDRYLTAANRLSRLAVGDPSLPLGSAQYTVSQKLLQANRMSEELPFSSRGGAAIQHYFPYDGEYVFNLEFTGSPQTPSVVEVRVDRELVAELTTSGRNLEASPNFPSVRTRADNAVEVRAQVKAGPRSVGVAFREDRTMVETRFPQYFPWGNSATFGTNTGGVAYLSLAKVDVSGPFQPQGPGDTPSRQRIFTCRPTAPSQEASCARQILEGLARRAYRRPATKADVDLLFAFYDKTRTQRTFDGAIQAAVERLLADPDFLFRHEVEPANARPGTPYRVDDVALASRLSFFLWSSVPDEELLKLAESGKLRETAVFDGQVRRMLADERASALVTNFAAQWLYLRNIRQVNPDSRAFPDWDDNLRSALARETELFLESQLREDRSIGELLSADYTFINERLARHYGIPNVYGNHFRRVTLREEDQRKGLLGHGSILMVTSFANRTSPVVRGKWLLENFLNYTPPPPPPNVPDLPPPSKETRVLSMRERVEQHRQNPVCAACHNVMDPLGFALENYDAIGRYREKEEGLPIDASGATPDGTKFNGLSGLREVMESRRDEFVATVVEKLLTFALGRELEYYDLPVVRKVVHDSAATDYRWSSVIEGITKSVPFLMKQGRVEQ